MSQDPNSDTLTDGIRIQAAAQYLADESDPGRNLFFYVYRIRIVNDGSARAQLMSRRWVIFDANNNREEVVGEGVVGKQPDLGSGEMFEYKSYSKLRTEWGTMEGTYTFAREDGSVFDAEIGRFFLVPSVDNALVPQ